MNTKETKSKHSESFLLKNTYENEKQKISFERY